jgi:hypothetical protein
VHQPSVFLLLDEQGEVATVSYCGEEEQGHIQHTAEVTYFYNLQVQFLRYSMLLDKVAFVLYPSNRVIVLELQMVSIGPVRPVCAERAAS